MGNVKNIIKEYITAFIGKLDHVTAPSRMRTTGCITKKEKDQK